MTSRLVALTGGIGAGKSTVARAFSAHGARVIDADALSRAVVDPTTSVGAGVLEEIVSRFGATMLSSDGGLDRGRMASTIFADDVLRAEYNAILRPALIEATVAAIDAERARRANAGVIVHEIPLLTRDSGELPWRYDCVVTVEASAALRIGRLIADRGYTPEHARARIAAQGAEEDRLSIADAVIRTDGGIADVHAQVDALWRAWTERN